jgi:hypothetical protein
MNKGPIKVRRGAGFNGEAMKISITTAAILMVLTSVTSAQEIDRTQEYRMWSAEQMINRLTEKFARSQNVCDRAKVWMPRLSDECKAAVVRAYPILGSIRDVAMSGDAVRWAAFIEVVHKFEAEIEGPLNTLERK